MKTESKQLAALTFCASTVPSILILPHAGWLWAGIAAVFSVLFALFAQTRPGIKNRYLLLLLLLWNLIALGAVSDILCAAFPNGGVLLGLLLLLLAAYAADRGVYVILRVGAVAVFAVIILYGMLLGFSLPGLEVKQLVPRKDIAWTLLPAAMTPMLSILLDKEAAKANKLWLYGIVVLTILAALVSSGRQDFYTAMKSVSVLGAMERLEPLVSVALTIGGFCLLGLICAVNGKLLSEIFQKRTLALPTNFFVGGACIWISSLLSGSILAIGTAIFWGLLPILPQPLEKQKKFEKKQKNA